MRATYRRCEPELSTGPRMTDTERDELYRRSLTLLLKAKGVTDAGLAEMKASTIPVSELEKIVLGKMAAPPETAQRVVAVADVPRFLEAGYEYVAALGRDRVILKSPNGKP